MIGTEANKQTHRYVHLYTHCTHTPPSPSPGAENSCPTIARDIGAFGCEQEGGRRVTFRDRVVGRSREREKYISLPVTDALPKCIDLGQHGGVELSKEKPEGTRAQ